MSIESTARAGTSLAPGTLLRAALRLDAAASAGLGVACLAAVGPLADWLELPQALLIVVAPLLVGWAAALWYLAGRPVVAAGAIWTVIAFNAAWVADSLALLALDGFSPSLAGQVVVALQAAGVLAFATLQYLGLRRS